MKRLTPEKSRWWFIMFSNAPSFFILNINPPRGVAKRKWILTHCKLFYEVVHHPS
jgi:hypothetical protein